MAILALVASNGEVVQTAGAGPQMPHEMDGHSRSSSPAMQGGADAHRPNVDGLSVLDLHQRILGMLADGTMPADVLESICRGVHAIEPRIKPCILLTDAGRQRFDRAVAPFHPQLASALNGRALENETAGTCTWAIMRGEPATCADTFSDTRWSQAWRDLCRSIGIRSGASFPIRSRDGTILGSLFLTFEEANGASEHHEHLAKLLVQLVATVLRHEALEQSLDQSERRYQKTIDALPVAVYTTDLDGRITQHNPAAVELWGRTPDVDDRWWGVARAFAADETPIASIESFAARCAQTGERVRGVELTIEHPDGSRRAAVGSAEPIRDDAGTQIGVICTVVDVTEQRSADERAKATEERYRAIAETQAECACRFRPDGTLLFVNHAYARWRGTTPEALIGTNFWPFIPEVDRGLVRAKLDAITPEHPETRIENRFISEAGERWTLWVNRGLKFDANGRPTELQSSGFDVTERAVETLARYRLLTEQIRDIALVIRASDGRILEANHPSEAAYGYSREQLLQLTVVDLRAPSQRAAAPAQLAEADGPGVLFETVHVRSDGTEFPVEVSARGANLGGQRVVLSIIRDITERKAAEDQLRRGRDTFLNLIQNAPFGVYVIDSKFRLIQVSTGSQKVFAGVRPLIGRDFAEVLRSIWPEPFASDAIARFRHTLDTGERFHSPNTIESRADVDTVEAYDWRLERITLPDGEFGVVCYFYDLSERRRYEAALLASEERQRIAVDSAHMGVFEWHVADDVAIWENDRPYEIFGRDRALGPIGRQEFVTSYILPEDREAFDRQVTHDVTHLNRVTWITRIRRPDASIRWVEITGNIRRAPDGRPERLLGVVFDITERKAAEDAIRTSEARFRNLADAMPQLVWTADERGAITYYNSRAMSYAGLVRLPDGSWQWEAVVHPDDLDATMRAWEASVATGVPYQCEHRIKMADSTYRWHLSRAIRAVEGASHWYGTATDIHDLKEVEAALRTSERALARHKDELEIRVEERTRELAETYERLRLSERFAMMGTLAAGLGHDLGNLLVPVRVRLESLANASLPTDLQEDVEAIKVSAEYLRRLAHGLRLLSLDPDRAPPAETTDVSSWWTDVHGVMRSVIPRGVELTSAIAPDCGVAAISKPALTQIVFNLIQNASDALRERSRGVMRIHASCADAMVRIVVSDDGPGMDEEVRARCMEPFFTTKARTISTGLGLVLVYGLVRNAGGIVELESQLGKGTCFTILIPMAKPGSADAAPMVQGLLDVKDARLRSFISNELAAHNVQTRGWDARDGTESLAVLDDAGKLPDLHVRACTILLASVTNPPSNVRVMGDRPHIGQIREAIRAAIHDAHRQARHDA